MNEHLKQSDWDDLYAYCDGLLPQERAHQIAQLLTSDPHWQEAYRRINQLEDLLDAYQPPPTDIELADRIISTARRYRWTAAAGRVIRFAAPLSAAAAILIAVLVTNVENHRATQPYQPAAAAQGAVEPFVVTNLDFFQDMDVAANLETMQEIEKLESHHANI